MSEHPPTSGPDQSELRGPRHIAIIMDGNGRWAKARGLPRLMGHNAGVEAVRRAVKAAIDLRIGYLTLYSFSSENWSRPASEIDELFSLMRRFIRRDLADLHQQNVRIRIIGERNSLEPDLLAMITESESVTADNDGLQLVIAFNYGGRNEIVRAVQALAREVAAGTLAPDAITPEALAARLDTHAIPDPDLLIRTSGEERLSNFLLWQCAYTEFMFMAEYWPDFSRDHLERAIAAYRSRDRRFGGLSARSAGQK
ncbi:MAG: isoprenyl transferase [Hyphomicrobiaceae bacterium]